MKIGIIGGGIAGCAAAYYLSKKTSDITIFEKDFIGAHSSGKSNGSIIPFIDYDINSYSEQLSDYALSVHNNLKMKFHSKFYYSKKPVVHLFKNNSYSKIYDNYKKNKLNKEFHFLSLGELRHIDARVSQEIDGGLYIKNSLEVDSYMLSKTFFDNAIQNGVNFVQKNINKIDADSGKQVRIFSDDESYNFDKIIISNGSWAEKFFMDFFGKSMLTPIKGQILRMKNISPGFNVSFWWGKNYITTKDKNITWLGTTHEDVGYDESITNDSRNQILQNAKEIFPFLDENFVVEQTACLRPMTKDSLPILGRLKDFENIFLCGGGSANGILFGPAMGKIISKDIFEEQLDTYINEFSVNRFL